MTYKRPEWVNDDGTLDGDHVDKILDGMNQPLEQLGEVIEVLLEELKLAKATSVPIQIRDDGIYLVFDSENESGLVSLEFLAESSRSVGIVARAVRAWGEEAKRRAAE